ncbi:hypothetical protein EON63_14505, partial [archaeon]
MTANSMTSDPHAHQHEEEVVKSLEGSGEEALREKGSEMYRGEQNTAQKVGLRLYIYTIHHIPYTIYHTPYTIYHIPYTIYHIPYTIYHIPYT